MMKVLKTFIFIAFFSFDLSSQSNSGFIISSNYSVGNLIDGELSPSVENPIASIKFQLDYSLVKWDHTILRMGAGYHFLKCDDSRIGYMQFPIVFQRFIKSSKSGFNTSLVLLPSYAFEENIELCINKNLANFSIEVAIRAGTILKFNKHKFGIEFEASGPMSNIQKFTLLKYIVYGVNIGYYL